MVQSRFRGKDDCVYCDQLFFVHVCLFVRLVGCSCVPEIRERKRYNLAEELNSLHHSLNFIRLLRVVITPSVTSLLH